MIMKKIVLSALLILSSLGFAQAGVIVLEGNYQGKNIYIQNPNAGSGVGFCTFEVTVNDQTSTDEINTSAFEVDFTAYQIKFGDKVVIKIKHKDDCKPKVLNPEVLKPRSTFSVVPGSMKVDKEGNFTWSTTNETSKMLYIVEQFKWNKWVKCGEVMGKGTVQENEYAVKVTPHSGENKFRIKQTDFSDKANVSDPLKYRAVLPEVTFDKTKIDKQILFSSATAFEMYDSFGNIVKKGVDSKVDISAIKKGTYYINYDNKTDSFVKK